MQLQLFNQPHKKKETAFDLSHVLPDESPVSYAEQLLSERFIAQNGMLLLRQKIASAYRQGDWKSYLKLVRQEMDFKKGYMTLSQVLKNNAMEDMLP